MSTRCGCASDTCSCYIAAGAGIAISGGGTKTNPYLIEGEGEPAPVTGSVPPGGTTNQVLKKNSGADYDTGWTDPPAVTNGVLLLNTGGTVPPGTPVGTIIFEKA